MSAFACLSDLAWLHRPLAPGRRERPCQSAPCEAEETVAQRALRRPGRWCLLSAPDGARGVSRLKSTWLPTLPGLLRLNVAQSAANQRARLRHPDCWWAWPNAVGWV